MSTFMTEDNKLPHRDKNSQNYPENMKISPQCTHSPQPWYLHMHSVAEGLKVAREGLFLFKSQIVALSLASKLLMMYMLAIFVGNCLWADDYGIHESDAQQPQSCINVLFIHLTLPGILLKRCEWYTATLLDSLTDSRVSGWKTCQYSKRKKKTNKT